MKPLVQLGQEGKFDIWMTLINGEVTATEKRT